MTSHHRWIVPQCLPPSLKETLNQTDNKYTQLVLLWQHGSIWRFGDNWYFFSKFLRFFFFKKPYLIYVPILCKFAKNYAKKFKFKQLIYFFGTTIFHFSLVLSVRERQGYIRVELWSKSLGLQGSICQ